MRWTQGLSSIEFEDFQWRLSIKLKDFQGLFGIEFKAFQGHLGTEFKHYRYQDDQIAIKLSHLWVLNYCK